MIAILTWALKHETTRARVIILASISVGLVVATCYYPSIALYTRHIRPFSFGWAENRGSFRDDEGFSVWTVGDFGVDVYRIRGEDFRSAVIHSPTVRSTLPGWLRETRWQVGNSGLGHFCAYGWPIRCARSQVRLGSLPPPPDGHRDPPIVFDVERSVASAIGYFIVLFLLWLTTVVCRIVHRHCHQRCIRCGYSLENLRTNWCPECGTREI